MPASWLDQALTPYAGLAPATVAFVVAAGFLGFFVRGAFGFGSNLPFVLLTTPILGPHHAIVVAALTALPASAILLPQGIADADYRVARSLVAGILAGTALGVWVFARLPGDWLMVVMAVLIIVLLALERTPLLERILHRFDASAPAPSFTMAAVTTATGSVAGGGTMYMLVVYLRLACRDAARLRATNVLISALFQFLRAAFVGVAGFLSPRVIAEAVVLLPALLVGTWAGTRFFRRSSPERFAGGLHWLLILAAAALLARGIERVIG